jgi:hypothetical protein
MRRISDALALLKTSAAHSNCIAACNQQRFSLWNCKPKNGSAFTIYISTSPLVGAEEEFTPTGALHNNKTEEHFEKNDACQPCPEFVVANPLLQQRRCISTKT